MRHKSINWKYENRYVTPKARKIDFQILISTPESGSYEAKERIANFSRLSRLS